VIEARIVDHIGQEQVIRSAEDMNRLVARVERRRDELAEAMLGADRVAAIAAERESDRIEDVYLPHLQVEIDRVRGLLDAEAADDHRRAKARAIKDRARGTVA